MELKIVCLTEVAEPRDQESLSVPREGYTSWEDLPSKLAEKSVYRVSLSPDLPDTLSMTLEQRLRLQDTLQALLSDADLVILIGGDADRPILENAAELALAARALTLGVLVPESDRKSPLEHQSQRLPSWMSGLDAYTRSDRSEWTLHVQRMTEILSDVITLPGLIENDFEEVRSLLRSEFLLGHGEAKDGDRALQAARMVVESLSMAEVLPRAGTFVFSVRGDEGLTLGEVNGVAETFCSVMQPEANILFQAVPDSIPNGRVSVGALVAGFGT